MVAIRICFVGDSITVGTGDDRYQGWPALAAAAEAARGHDVTLYNLGVRGDTSVQIAARWHSESRARLPDDVNGALVFSFGVNDAAIEPTADPDRQRVPPAQSIATAREILSTAQAWLPTLMIGPTPVRVDGVQIVRSPQVTYDFLNERTRAINAAYADLAAELGVPYLELFTELVGDPAWAAALQTGDGVHPAQAGYAMMAERIGRWPGWRRWFDG